MSELTNDMAWPGPNGGSGCTNPECPATGRYIRVLSKQEIAAVYKTSGQRDSLPFDWPLPDDCTHACTRCGWMYFGMKRLAFNREEYDVPDLPFEFEADDDLTPGENVERLLDEAPDGATLDQLALVASRTIRGAGRSLVERHANDRDDLDVTRYPAGDYM